MSHCFLIQLHQSMTSLRLSISSMMVEQVPKGMLGWRRERDLILFLQIGAVFLQIGDFLVASSICLSKSGGLFLAEQPQGVRGYSARAGWKTARARS